MVENNNTVFLSNNFWNNATGQFLRNLSYEGNYHTKYYYPELIHNNILAREQQEQNNILASGFDNLSTCENSNKQLDPESLPWSPTSLTHVDPTCQNHTLLMSTSKEHTSYPYYVYCSNICRSSGFAWPKTDFATKDIPTRNTNNQCSKMELPESGGTKGTSRELTQDNHDSCPLETTESVTSEDSVFSEDYTTINESCPGSDDHITTTTEDDDADSSFSSAGSSTSTLEGAEGTIQCGADVKDEPCKDKVNVSKQHKHRHYHYKNRPDINLDIPAPSIEVQGESPVDDHRFAAMDSADIACAGHGMGRGGAGGISKTPVTSCSDIASSCFHEDREFDFLKTEPVRRATSLKTYKTPPGTPHRKKGVRFADALGLDLESVRHILNLDDPPEVPKSAMEHLRQGLETEHASAGVRYLSALFSQPGADPAFVKRVLEGKVVLENCIVDDKDLTLNGLIRVANIDFHKKVLIRYTTNSWLTSDDIVAGYVHNSNDGATDRFSFSLTVPKYFAVGQRLEMAVMYVAGGTTYWDNNFGANYAVECYARALPTCESDNTWMHFL